MSRQLYALGDFVHDNLNFFLDFNAGPPVNGFMPPIDRTAIGAAAENRPVIGRFELEPDEALILEVEPPKGVYWSYSLGNQWWETIHYGRHQSSLNAPPGRTSTPTACCASSSARAIPAWRTGLIRRDIATAR